MRLLRFVWPAPEGDDRIRRRKSSFDILQLLRPPLGFGLEFYDKVRDPQVLRLRSDRIYLAGHLLQKEIEFPPERLVFGQVSAHLLDVARQPPELFRDVRPLEQEHDLLFEPR